MCPACHFKYSVPNTILEFEQLLSRGIVFRANDTPFSYQFLLEGLVDVNYMFIAITRKKYNPPSSLLLSENADVRETREERERERGRALSRPFE